MFPEVKRLIRMFADQIQFPPIRREVGNMAGRDFSLVGNTIGIVQVRTEVVVPPQRILRFSRIIIERTMPILATSL